MSRESSSHDTTSHRRKTPLATKMARKKYEPFANFTRTERYFTSSPWALASVYVGSSLPYRRCGHGGGHVAPIPLSSSSSPNPHATAHRREREREAKRAEEEKSICRYPPRRCRAIYTLHSLLPPLPSSAHSPPPLPSTPRSDPLRCVLVCFGFSASLYDFACVRGCVRLVLFLA